MKKIVFALVFILSAISGFSQDFEPSYTIGINSGLDHNYNAYQFQKYTKDANYEYYGISNQFNVGMDFGVSVSKKLRVRVELRYVNTSFGINWGDTVQYPSNPRFTNTTWNVNNFDINLRLDYLLLSYKKLDLYASPGLRYEYYIGEYILTTQQKGGVKSNITDLFNFMGSAYPRSIIGGSLAMLAKYNITKHVGITLSPDYTIFFRDYVRSNNKGYERISLNAGFEFKF